MDFASFIVIFLFGAIAGAFALFLFQAHGDAVKLNEGFDERYKNFCKLVDERYEASHRNEQYAQSYSEDDLDFLNLPETQERYLNEDEITNKILTQIKPTLDQIEENTRYSSDHPTNIWREK